MYRERDIEQRIYIYIYTHTYTLYIYIYIYIHHATKRTGARARGNCVIVYVRSLLGWLRLGWLNK